MKIIINNEKEWNIRSVNENYEYRGDELIPRLTVQFSFSEIIYNEILTFFAHPINVNNIKIISDLNNILIESNKYNKIENIYRSIGEENQFISLTFTSFE